MLHFKFLLLSWLHFVIIGQISCELFLLSKNNFVIANAKYYIADKVYNKSNNNGFIDACWINS